MERLALSPCMIGTCRIKNRFAMTAANLGWCRGGYVTEDVVAFYRERAIGQAGLIIAGAAGVDPVRVNQIGMMQIYDDRFIPPMKTLTEEVHKYGSKIFLQLMHAGAYAKQGEHAGSTAVAPSSYFCNFTRETGEELSEEGIRQIISYYGDAAVRASKAGFDGVELIGSAGYLVAEFLSKATNHRTDAYGGSLRNRARFLLEIIDAVRNAAGREFPIIVRLSGTDFIPEGNGPEDFLAIGRMLDGKADALNVTGGWHESQVPQITYNVPKGMYLYLAKAMKESVSIPVIGCNRLDVPTAVRTLEQGTCDMAGMLRAFICEPFLVKKYSEGKTEEIRPCIACNQCMDEIFSGKGLSCALNPFVGKEYLEDKRSERECSEEGHSEKEHLGRERSEEETSRPSVLVIGAGVSGLAYAALAARDNCVTIWERSSRFGGVATALAKIPDREGVRDYLDYLYSRCLSAGVDFKWKKEADLEEIERLLEEGRFDRAVIAVGSCLEPKGYLIEDGAPVCSAEACILDTMPRGRRIVVIGSGYKAAQTALYCISAEKPGDAERDFLSRYAPEYLDFASDAMDWGESSVTLLASGKRAGEGFGKSTRWMMQQEIRHAGVIVETEARVLSIGKDHVAYQAGGKEKTIPSDLVVIAEGWKKIREPAAASGRIQVIGDARRPGRLSEAVEDAYHAALETAERNEPCRIGDCGKK